MAWISGDRNGLNNPDYDPEAGAMVAMFDSPPLRDVIYIVTEILPTPSTEERRIKITRHFSRNTKNGKRHMVECTDVDTGEIFEREYVIWSEEK